MNEDVVSEGTATTMFPDTMRRVRRGARLCGLFALGDGSASGATRLVAVVSDDGTLWSEEAALARGQRRFASLAAEVPAAAWYERRIHDLFGLRPVGHPQLDPLVLPLRRGVHAPLGPDGDAEHPLDPDPTPLRAHVHGEGVFTIPYGPVRSGVFETVEYLVETAGEDIPHIRARIYYKHRGVEAAFEGRTVADGVLLAERVEGVASVAHALAFCGAVEVLGGIDVPAGAQLARVVHAELERIANHLDSVVRHTEAAGQAVAYAAFSHHKERVQRLRGRLCGSRFGRGVVVPGGVARPLRLAPSEVLSALGKLQHDVEDDFRRLMGTPSFLDRLRRTGILSNDDARRFAALGPVGRASGAHEDVRRSRPYGAYERLGNPVGTPESDGDALARQRVRIEEIEGSFHLVRQAADMLDELGEPARWRSPVPPLTGEAIGWAEAPQGEVLSLVRLEEGRLAQVAQRSASFHNLAAYPAAFGKDILTDVAFIEASFGLSIAGAAG